DPEGEALTFATVDGPAHGSVTLTGGDGHFVYTPDPDYVGRDSFTVVATDPVGEATEAKVDLTILGR
ncbi:MAG: Ig-like domain-containing protein, partial [Myxococcota bacterium]